MPTHPFETVLYQQCGPVAHVVLNRPNVINAFNVQMRDDLSEVLAAIRWDSDVRVLLLRGAGEREFCAGADLTEFGTAPSQMAARQARWERDIFGDLRDLKIPTVAAMHGHVVGSGVELALLCDIRIAANNAVFSMPETYYGLIAAAGGTQLLRMAIGQGRALDMLLTGKSIGASEAHDIGLVQRVVLPTELETESEKIVRKLGSNDPRLLAATKTALAAARDLSLLDGLARERRLSIMLDRISEAIEHTSEHGTH